MSQPSEQVLVASVHDVRPLATLLRGVSFSSNAAISISDAGLTVSAEEGRALVARAYIPYQLFDEYVYKPEPQDAQSQSSSAEEEPSTTFMIPLDTLLECLNIFGTGSSSLSQAAFESRKRKKWKHESDDSDEGRGGRSRGRKGGPPKGNTRIDQYFWSITDKQTGMRMSYSGSGHPLTLILAEDAAGPTTTCQIQTMGDDSLMELPFDSSRKVIKIILRSSWLADALSELDPSCDKLTFVGIPPTEGQAGSSDEAQITARKPTLRLSAEGTFGSTQMDYPNDRDVLETFECATMVKFTYRLAHINCASRALQASLKTSLRIDDEGLLSLQFMMPGGPEAFLEFRCLPLQEP